MSSATDPGNRSSAEIEREVEATRSGLSDTLGELRDRAAPGQLFEQALDYARTSGGAELVRNLGQSVRDNPLPLLLIGAGIGWLMFTGNNRPSQAQSDLGHTAGPLPRTSSRIRVHGGMGEGQVTGESRSGSMTESASATAGAVAGRASDAASSLGDSIAGAAKRAADSGSSTYRGAMDAASSATDSVRGAAASAAERLGDFGSSGKQGIGWLMREQPLVLGAIGVALGAAVGALVPSTETEDRLMGETRDSVADRAQSAVRHGYEEVKEAAGEHVQRAAAAVKDAAGQEKDKLGGSAGEASNAVTEAAQQARHATRDAVHNLADKARSALASDEAGAPAKTERPDEPGRRDVAGSGPAPAPRPSGPA